MRYKRNKDFVWEKVAEGVVVVNGQTGMVYELNETAGFIWRALNEKKTCQNLIDLLSEEYEEVKGGDVKESVKSMVKSGLLDEIV